MRHFKKPLLIAITILLVIGFALSSYADNWDGNGGTGSGPGTAVTGSCSLPYTDTAKLILGYRFTVFNQSGNSGTRVGHSIEVYFKNPVSGCSIYWYQFKRPHSGSDLTKLNSPYEYDGESDFKSVLNTTTPSTGLESWIIKNKDYLLAYCEVGQSISTDSYYIVAEPLLATTFDGVHWLGTVQQYMKTGPLSA